MAEEPGEIWTRYRGAPGPAAALPSSAPTAGPPGVTGSPEPPDAAPRLALLASAIAGIGAAIAVPLTEPGIGWPIAGLLVAAAVVVSVGPKRLILGPRTKAGPASGTPAGGAGDAAAAKAPGDGEAGPSRRTAVLDRAWRLTLAAAALALLAVGAMRAAAWVFVICLLTAVVAGSLALVGGRGWAGLAGASIGLPLEATASSWRWAGNGLKGIRAVSPNLIRGLLRGVAVGVVLVLIFGALLASADSTFAESLRVATPDVSFGQPIQALLLFVLAALLTLAGIRLASGARTDAGEPTRVQRRLRRLDWVPALAMLDGLFLWFVIVQFPTLFENHGYVLDPEGPSYAEYARGGFGQLIAVAALTLAVVGVVVRFTGYATSTDRSLVRVLVGACCVLTLIILASAGKRLALYTEAYGFTRRRLIFLAVGVFLAIVFVFLIAAGVRLRAAWLPRAVALAAVATVLGFAAVNPEAVIADTVVHRYEKDRHLDHYYLESLTVDAVPAIDRLPEPLRSCVLKEIISGMDKSDPWYAYNQGRERARAIIADRPVAEYRVVIEGQQWCDVKVPAMVGATPSTGP